MEEKSVKVDVEVQFDYFRSVSVPDEENGRLGRINSIKIDNNEGSRRYPINVESIFKIPDDLEETRFKELKTETYLIVQDFLDPKYSSTY
jgi:hypothetical protein